MLVAVLVVGLISGAASAAGFTPYAGQANTSATKDLSTPKDKIGSAQGLAVTDSGDVVVADTNYQVLRRIRPDGSVTILAGTGSAGYSTSPSDYVNGQNATGSKLNYPEAVAVLGDQVYVADTLNQRIRRVSAGRMMTIAGNGTSDNSKNGTGCTVRNFPDTCGTQLGDGLPAISAFLSKPGGVAVSSSGVVYFSDTGNNRIRRIRADGIAGDASRIVETVAGNGGPAFSGDGGPALKASLRQPRGIVIDGDLLYFADYANHRVRRVDLATGIISTVAGTGVAGFSGDDGPAPAARLNHPTGLAIHQGILYIADTRNHRIRAVSQSGAITTVAGNGASGFAGDGVAPTATSLHFPHGIAIGPLGEMYIADTSNQRIRKVTDGAIRTIAGTLNQLWCCKDEGLPAPNVYLSSPSDVVSFGDEVFIADTGHSRIVKIDAQGRVRTIAGSNLSGYSGDGGPATKALLNLPKSLAIDRLGNLYIADTYNQRIRMIDRQGIITTVAGNGTHSFGGDGGPAAAASISYPYGIAIAPDGSLLIADTNNHRIRRVDPQGIISTVAGTGERGAGPAIGDGGPALSARFNFPGGVAVDGTGNIYVADTKSHRIRRIDAVSGVVTTFAGKGPVPASCSLLGRCTYTAGGGFEGDGGPAVDAYLNYPQDVVVGTDGMVYVADTANSRVRRIDLKGSISSSASGLSRELGIGASNLGVFVANTGSHEADLIPHAGS